MRRARDFYETSPWQVDALSDHLPELAGVVWECCVGDGSLLARLRENRPDLDAVVTNDLDATKPASYHLDATRAETWATLMFDHDRPDWIITNPPFSAAFPILQHAVAIARQGVVIMARLSFMEPTQSRGPWLAAHPCDKRITLERYSFTENGKSDNVTTEWLVWARVPLAGPANVSAFGYKTPATVTRKESRNADEQRVLRATVHHLLEGSGEHVGHDGIEAGPDMVK